MGSGGGGSTSGKTDFPAYMKMFHYGALAGTTDVNAAPIDVLTTSVTECFNIAVSGNSPYYNYIVNNEPISTVFNSGASVAGSYAKIADLLQLLQDIDFDLKKSSYVSSIVEDVSLALDDDINVNILPRFKANIRGMGAMNSSAYAVGEALIWDSKLKALAKERVAIEELSLRTTQSYIDFQKQMVLVSTDVVKVYYSLKTDIDTHYSQMGEHDRKWDLEMFQYLNNTLASISGAALSTGAKKSAVGSAVGGALSGAAMGAAAGFMMGGPPGAVIGAIGGGVMGLAGGLS